MVKKENVCKSYIEDVEKILKEVEHILRDEAIKSHGAKIVIKTGVGEVSRVSYEINEKVVI